MLKVKWAAKSLQRPLRKAKQNRKQSRSLFHLSSSLKNPFQNNKKKEKRSQKKRNLAMFSSSRKLSNTKCVWCFKKQTTLHKTGKQEVFALQGSPGGASGTEPPASAGDEEMWVRSLVREGPLENKWQHTAVCLSEKSHGQRSLVGYRPWGHNELGTTEQIYIFIYIYIFTLQHRELY